MAGERSELRAGPLDASLVGVDLRYLRLGEEELVRRIYAAVRDRNWNTVAGEVSGFELRREEEGFVATFDVRHHDAEVDFAWRGRIEGDPGGRIVYELDGRAAREMRYNRVGFCLLHPIAETAGGAYRGTTPAGPVEGTFPELVGPQGFADGRYVPLYPSVSSLRTRLPSGGWVEIEFEGDLFETEDQRNWTDASFKSYCTPLSLGFPRTLAAGEQLHQRIAITVTTPAGTPRRRPAPGTARKAAVEVGDPAGPLPRIGLGHGAEIETWALPLLRELRPAHLRVDLDLRDGWEEILDGAATDAAALDTALELALHMSADCGPAAARVADRLDGVDVARVLVIDAEGETATSTESTSTALLETARASLPDLPIYGGTDMNFCELNRTRPDPKACDGLFYPVVPQVHAFDDLSLVETPAAQADTVRSAMAFAEAKPIAVSPVTLRRRFNAVATGAEAEPDESELPDSVDPRQATPLGAAWTVASLAALAAAGAGSVTYYEAMGWHGTLEADVERPPAFPSRPRQKFPLWDVFAALAGGGTRLATEVDDPLAIAALGWEGDSGRRLLVANLGDRGREVAVRGAGTASGMLTLSPFETVELSW